MSRRPTSGGVTRDARKIVVRIPRALAGELEKEAVRVAAAAGALPSRDALIATVLAAWLAGQWALRNPAPQRAPQRDVLVGGLKDLSTAGP